MKSKIFVILIITCFISGCKDAEMKTFNFPFLVTKPVSEIDANGATFTATVIVSGKDTITEYGFIWSDGLTNFKTSVINNSVLKEFKIRIKSDLVLNQTYSCKAYIITTKHLVYGNTVTFESLGSLLPQILDFSPKEGFDGDTVRLRGNYFSSLKENNKVFVNNVQADIISSNDSSINFIMPKQSFSGLADIAVEVNSTRIIAPSKYNILGPIIELISPMFAHSGSTISIKGKNLIQNGSNVDVYFGTFKAEVRNRSYTQLDVIVPIPYNYLAEDLLTDKSLPVTLTNGLKKVSFSSNFNITKLWEQKSATPFSWSYKYQAVSYNGKGYILELNDKLVYEYDPLTNIWNKYSTKEFPAERNDGSTYLTWGNNMYKIGGYDYTSKSIYDVWAFNLTTKTWTKRNNIPFALNNGSYFTLNNKLYIVTGQGQVWKCDLENQLYTRLNDFPGNFYFSSSFVANGTAYIVVYGHTWRYNESSDTWNDIATNPFFKEHYDVDAIGFALNNTGYVLHSGEYLYKYDITYNCWTQVSNYPGKRADNSYKTTFIIGDKAYIAATSGNYSGNSPLMYSYYEYNK